MLGITRCFGWSVHHLLVLVVVELLLLSHATHWNSWCGNDSWGSSFSIAAAQPTNMARINFVHVHGSLRSCDYILTDSSWIRVSLSLFLRNLWLYLYWVTGLNRLTRGGGDTAIIRIAISDLSRIDRIAPDSHVQRDQRTLSTRLFVVSKMGLLCCCARNILLLSFSNNLPSILRVRIILQKLFLGGQRMKMLMICIWLAWLVELVVIIYQITRDVATASLTLMTALWTSIKHRTWLVLWN